jgi:hypothetical protein
LHCGHSAIVHRRRGTRIHRGAGASLQAMNPPALRPLSAGEILDVSFQLYRRHFAALATVALACSGVPVLFNVFIEASGGTFANLRLSLLYLILLAILSSIGTAATVFIVSESYLGRTLGPWDALARSTPLLGRLIACSILFTLLIFLGFIFFFFPGVIITVGFILAFPALVLEDLTPTGALRRSWELSRGARLRMFGLLLTLLVLLYIPIVALSGVATMFLSRGPVPGSATGLVAAVLAGVIQLLVYPLFYCVLTVAYYDLRVRKEGFDLEVLASTLQIA